MAGPYKISYAVDYHPDGLSKQELIDMKRGGADAVLIASLMRPGGALSILYMSRDGAHGGHPLDATEMFKVWALLSHRLATDEMLGDGRRLVCSVAHQLVSTAILKDDKRANVLTERLGDLLAELEAM